MFEKESVQAIKEIGKELERLHDLLGMSNKEGNADVYQQIKKLENTLDEIARRHNGLEY